MTKKLVERGSISKAAYQIVKETVKQGFERLDAYQLESDVVQELDDKMSALKKKGVTIRIPQQSKTKGPGSRLISTKDKARDNDRKCNGCGKRGVSHDKRNCPALKERYFLFD